MIELFKAWLLTITPSIELRGAIPYLFIVSKDSTLLIIGVLSIMIVNILIGFIAFLLAKEIILIGRKIRFFNKYWNKYIERSQKRLEKTIKKWKDIKIIGLAIFIGIPIPGSGVYTGAMAAHLLGLSKKEFIIADIIGVLIATIIVLTLSLIFL